MNKWLCKTYTSIHNCILITPCIEKKYKHIQIHLGNAKKWDRRKQNSLWTWYSPCGVRNYKGTAPSSNSSGSRPFVQRLLMQTGCCILPLSGKMLAQGGPFAQTAKSVTPAEMEGRAENCFDYGLRGWLISRKVPILFLVTLCKSVSLGPCLAFAV